MPRERFNYLSPGSNLRDSTFFVFLPQPSRNSAPSFAKYNQWQAVLVTDPQFSKRAR